MKERKVRCARARRGATVTLSAFLLVALSVIKTGVLGVVMEVKVEGNWWRS